MRYFIPNAMWYVFVVEEGGLQQSRGYMIRRHDTATWCIVKKVYVYCMMVHVGKNGSIVVYGSFKTPESEMYFVKA